ncbi:MAG: YbjN domain-containing protein [Clostridiales bacterium]|nr:YbjN domain-containing protein [Clostridiales bacterium]
MEEKFAKAALSVYNKLCNALEEAELKFEKDVENLVVFFTMNGDDIPMKFTINVDAKRQLVIILSHLPFKFDEKSRLNGAMATNHINNSLADGSFDYDYETGAVVFRQTTSFRESLISSDLLMFMIAHAVTVVDEYNDKLLMVAKGVVSPDVFL